MSSYRGKTDSFYENYAYVLDFLPYGHPLTEKSLFKSEPIAQVIGSRLLCFTRSCHKT
jgi:putative nucleotide binding protein